MNNLAFKHPTCTRMPFNGQAVELFLARACHVNFSADQRPATAKIKILEVYSFHPPGP